MPFSSLFGKYDLGKCKTVTTEKHLQFEEHVLKQCKKAGQKLFWITFSTAFSVHWITLAGQRNLKFTGMSSP